MKTLLLYCNSFGYTPTDKTLDFVPDANESQEHKDDEENEVSVLKKVVKQLKWIMKKNSTRSVVIHSFAHLSDSKADQQF